MAKRKHTTEQVINELLRAEVATAEGRTVAEACRKTGVTEQTFYRWLLSCELVLSTPPPCGPLDDPHPAF